MEDIKSVLLEMVKPLVDDPNSLNIQQLPSLEEDELILCIYAPNEDIARLIGKKGSMANAIRQMMAIGSRVFDKHITIKFESYE